MTLQTIAQLIMLATLILMITGRTPIYMTAIRVRPFLPSWPVFRLRVVRA